MGGRRGAPAPRRQVQREAEELGVFGVPSYLYREELFWGGDRLEMLRDRIDGDRLLS